MAYILMESPEKIQGEVTLQGSKNASLPMFGAALLHKGITILKHCPDIQDVRQMAGLLKIMGCDYQREGETCILDTKNMSMKQIPEEQVKKLRSSVVLLGAMLGRFHEAVLDYPGGCNIGDRKIDLHISVLQALGYEIQEEERKLYGKGRIHQDVKYRFPYPSVGATENAILASVLSDDYVVILENVAKEPEIVELCDMLIGMGADICGAGCDMLRIRGVKQFHDSEYQVCGDRIVSATYGAALLAVGGELTIHGLCPFPDASVLKVFRELGMEYHGGKEWIQMKVHQKKNWQYIEPYVISTAPYPGFPTDMQSQMMAVMCGHVKTGILVETIFENRMQVADELRRMGAEIYQVDNKAALIYGGRPLHGCTLYGKDLRGTAALLIAGLMAEGNTQIYGTEYIERGYEDITRDFALMGVKLKKEE